jgi:predicted Zn-dependent peptidase
MARKQNSVQVTHLSNGTIIATDRFDSGITAVGIIHPVGTRYETREQNGLTHFTEHMVYCGTKTRTEWSISNQMDKIGAEANASTEYEYTQFYANFENDEKKLGHVIDNISDIVLNADFPQRRLERERRVILEEIYEYHDRPYDHVEDVLAAAIYGDTPMGRPILGTEEQVKLLPRDAFVDYYATHFNNGNRVIAAAGDIDHDAFVKAVEPKFGHLNTAPRAIAEPAVFIGGDIRDPRNIKQVHLSLAFEGVGYNHPDYYAMEAVSTIMGNGNFSRLYHNIRTKHGWTYGVSSKTNSFFDSGYMSINGAVNAENAPLVLMKIASIAAKFPESVKKSEIASMKNLMRTDTIAAYEDATKRMDFLSFALLRHGKTKSLEERLDIIESLTLPQVQETAARLFYGNTALVAVGPVEKLPPLDAVRQILKPR